MLEVARAIKPDIYKKRAVSAHRRFPKGCGRYAPPLEGLPSESLNGNGAIDKGKNLPGGTPSKSTVEGRENIQTRKQRPEESSGPFQSSELKMVKRSNYGEEEALACLTRTMTIEMAKPSHVEMLKPPDENDHLSFVGSVVREEENAINIINSTVRLEVSNQKSFLLNFSAEIDDGISKLYGPSKRRKAFVNRRFPLGCGRNAPITIGEEGSKQLVEMSRSIGMQEAEDNSDEKIQLAIDGIILADEVQKNGQNTVEGEQGTIVSANSVDLSLSELPSLVEKKGSLMSPSPSCLEISCHIASDKNDDTGMKEVIHEEHSEKIIPTEACVVDEDEMVLDVHTGDVSKEDEACLAGKNEKAIVEKNTSGPGLDLTEVVKKAESLLFDIQEELRRFDEAEDDEIVEPLMSETSFNGKQRPQADVLLKNIMGATAEETEKRNGRKRKCMATKSSLERKSKAKKQIRPAKRKLLSFGSFPLKHKNSSSEVIECSLIVSNDGDTTLAMAPIRENCSMNSSSLVSSCSSLNKTCNDELPTRIDVKKSLKNSYSMSKTKSNKLVKRAKTKLSSIGDLAPKPQNICIEEETGTSFPLSNGNDLVLDVRPLRTNHCINLPPFGSSLDSISPDEMPPRAQVRKILRLFQSICRKLLQNEESTCTSVGEKNRIDYAAIRVLKEKNLLPDTSNPVIGGIPGVEVGDQFHYRAELRLVGLHRSYQSGIDFTRINRSLVALSIVASVGEADDMDHSDFLIYSGSGGRPSEGDKPPEDQKLIRGNLALKNAIEDKTPVRVIRRCKDLGYDESLDGKPKQLSTFTYDGLYHVEDYWFEKGPLGFSVYKFKLRRIPGQPEIALMDVRSRSGETKGLLMEDISSGTERIPIPMVNTVDDEKPMPFTYIAKMIYPSWYEPLLPNGCNCIGKCSSSKACSCAAKNGGDLPYNFNGAIVQVKPLVYECGPSCKCPPSCYNRVSQQGIRFQLEVFKTLSRGWGVRSLNSIPSGSFICEYVGELLQDMDAEQRSNDEYLFDIGRTMDDHGTWDDLPSSPDSQGISRSDDTDNTGFTIDAAHYGNVGRFINHSCSPNLYAQDVAYDHDDKRMPHILFFASENIPPLKELTYDYNYTIGQVLDSNGNAKRKDCHCGSDLCIGRLY